MTTSVSFADRLTHIEAALKQGDWVTTDFQIVKTSGISWVWLILKNKLLSLLGQNPWKAYRIDEVAKAIFNAGVTHNQCYSPEVKARIVQIYYTLSRKADHSINNKREYQEALQTCLKVLKIAPSVESRANIKVAISNFAQELSTRIAATKTSGESFSISPLSIVAALSMALYCIKEDQKIKFIEKIGLKGLSEDEVHVALAEMLKGIALPEEFTGGKINVAQGLAYKESVKVADSLKQLVKQTYSADIIVNNNLQDTVNAWVDAKTDHLIPKLLSDNSAAVVLLNAVCLALKWELKFEKPSQGWPKGEFTCLDTTKTPVSMMSQTGDFLINESDTFSMLEIPYVSPSGRKLSQLIFLPAEQKDFATLESSLTAETIKKCRQSAVKRQVELSLPKTKMESEFELLKLLEEMGLPLDQVDLNILPFPITNVIHKTFVSNDEEGTKAAAVTAVIFFKCIPPTPLQFNVNRSYTYLIMDGDMILFRGRVSDKAALIVD